MKYLNISIVFVIMVIFEYTSTMLWSNVFGVMRFCYGFDKGTVVLRQIASDDVTFLPRVITGDKSCIYGYNPETKEKNLVNVEVQTSEKQSQEHAH
jgi:hypothetical protein